MWVAFNNFLGSFFKDVLETKIIIKSQNMVKKMNECLRMLFYPAFSAIISQTVLILSEAKPCLMVSSLIAERHLSKFIF